MFIIFQIIQVSTVRVSGILMRKTMEVLFSGKVQKVGFRACVKNAGQSLGLCGEVENLPDGRVRGVHLSACDYPRGCCVGVCADGVSGFYGAA